MKKVLFRSAVSGYNRDDVNEFIAETDARHADEAEAAAKRIAELEAELETNKNIYEMKISGLNELLEKSSAEAKRAALDSEKKLADIQANSARELAGARNDAASARQRSEELKKSILEHCTKYVAKYAMPRELEFRPELPKTLVGKVAYRVLEEEEAAKER